VSSNITDTSNLLLDSEIDPDTGDFSNVQISDDVVRNSIMRLTYQRNDATLDTKIWGEYRELDYEGQESDRDIREVGAVLDYRATALLTTGISGRYTLTDDADRDGDETRYSITGRVSYQLSRKLRTTFDLRYQNQDSDGGSVNEYSEFSSFVRLVYGFARVERPGRR
jgi:predicted porin